MLSKNKSNVNSTYCKLSKSSTKATAGDWRSQRYAYKTIRENMKSYSHYDINPTFTTSLYIQSSVTYFTYLLTLSNLHGNCEPTIVLFTKSSILPEASRTAAPPANMTNMAYEIMDKSKAQKVPFGIASPGSFRSPQILAPA
uniref:Uncharacterized protein n=1 Tax=Glossina austeni TaxID=7395 RepID=A0A1A9VB45_GLOAU